MKSNETDFSKMLGDMESAYPQWKSSWSVRAGQRKATVQSWPVFYKSTKLGPCLVGLLWTGLANNRMIFLGETSLLSKELGKRHRIGSKYLPWIQTHSTSNISGE